MERQDDELALRRKALKLRLAAMAEKLVAHIEGLTAPKSPLEAERMAKALKAADAAIEQIFKGDDDAGQDEPEEEDMNDDLAGRDWRAELERKLHRLAEACTSVPLRVEYEGRRAPDHPLQKLIDRPNPEQGGADLREALYGGLQTAGNAYVEAAFLDADVPAELWSLRPDRMKVVAGGGG